MMVCALACALVLVATVPAGAAKRSASVIPPHARVGGLTYGEWSARQWAWQIEAPNDPADPVVDPNPGTEQSPEPVNCAARQSGNVWFLAGTTYAQNPGPTYRSCSVPAGTFLFIPLIDSWIDNLNCPPGPPFTATADELKASVAGQIDGIAPGSLHASVDGADVAGLDDSGSAFRAQADGFSYSLGSDNVLGALFCGAPFPEGTTPPPPGAFADGVYVMLPPLSVGTHDIAFGGAIGGFTEDVHYTITVGSS
jgi:hypothetical protein